MGRIRELAEQLDAQDHHLRQLHDELDAAVLDAYGWSDLLPLLRIARGTDTPSCRSERSEEPAVAATADAPDDKQILRVAQDDNAGNDRTGGVHTREGARREFDEAVLERLVALNTQRAAEEARGEIRWFRPEFQNPVAAGEREPEQTRLATAETTTDADADVAARETAAIPAAKPQPWPRDTVEQVRAVADLLAASRCHSRSTRSACGSPPAARGSGACRCWSRCWSRWAARRSRTGKWAPPELRCQALITSRLATQPCRSWPIPQSGSWRHDLGRIVS